MRVGPLAFSPRVGLGAKWENPFKDDTKRDWFLKNIEDEAKRREIEEGNRLFYVAMTRAEEHLVFSYSCFGKRKEQPRRNEWKPAPKPSGPSTQ